MPNDLAKVGSTGIGQHELPPTYDDLLAEHERLIEELSRANRRLSGTLRIVLGTLDALDVVTLFSRVLDEITTTMDAWAALAYLAEGEGFRLSGTTQTLGDTPAPVFLTTSDPVVSMVAHIGSTLRMQMCRPTRDDLRSGQLSVREVQEMGTGESLKVPATALPPFASYAVVPVWFGGSLIALLQVGWRHEYRLRDDDVRLLDSVAEYLSVQLAGAIAAYRAQRAERLQSAASTLRERLIASEDPEWPLVREVLRDAAEAIDAAFVPLEGNVYQRTTLGAFRDREYLSVPVDLGALRRQHGAPKILLVSDLEGLAEWLEGNGVPSAGLLVLVGNFDDMPVGCMYLREAAAESFDDAELSFVRRLVEDVWEVARGRRAQAQSKHISQALQSGMRNELQKVDGLSAQSVYSSATEAAFVGGDFYDLIRLPSRHACIIMGDVSGKGVEAASVSSAVKTALAAYAWEGLRPARMVEHLNDFLLGFSRVETFATMFVGMMDLEARTLTYCSAGHPPAFIVRAQTGELVTLGVQSGVVGAFEGMAYRDGETDIQDGDILLLYTDGVTEARNCDGEFFGEDGLSEAIVREVAKGYDGLCDRLLRVVDDFTGNSLEDDVAMVVLRVDAEA